jgi:hypothetical protein
MSIDYSASAWYGIFISAEEYGEDDCGEMLDKECQKIEGLSFLPVNEGYDTDNIGYGICYGPVVSVEPYTPHQELNTVMSQIDINAAYKKINQICDALDIAFTTEPQFHLSFYVS